MAISASLLPPAVNTGLYWAMAMLSSSFGDSVHNNGTETLDHIQVGALLTVTVIFLSQDRVQDFKFEYAEYGDIPLELFWRGMISLTLTCLNILCIVMVGTLMLLLKQVGAGYTILDTKLSEQLNIHSQRHIQNKMQKTQTEHIGFWLSLNYPPFDSELL